MAQRIGAQHGEVEAAGRSLDLAGELATMTGRQAAGYASEMEQGLDEVTRVLTDHFEDTAADLRRAVADHKARLAATDWAGASKDSAIAAEQALDTEVDRVLEAALAQVTSFRASLRQQAEGFRSTIETELQAAMQAADHQYGQLAEASRRFLANLREADATIRFR